MITNADELISALLGTEYDDLGYCKEAAETIKRLVSELDASNDAIKAANELADSYKRELDAMFYQEPFLYYLDDEDGDREYSEINEFSMGRSGGTPLYSYPVPKA